MQKFLQHYHGVPLGLRRLLEPMCGDDSLLRRIPGLRQATGYVRHSRVPMPHRLENLNLLMQLDPAKVLDERFLRLVNMRLPVQQMQGIWDECEASGFVNRMLAYDWRFTLADSDLPKVRGATGMAGIDVSFPLLADEIVDFSMDLPVDWKVRRYKLRWFSRKRFEDSFLTKSCRRRNRIRLALWRMDPSRSGPEKLAQNSLDSLSERGIIRVDFAQKLIADQLPQHPGYYGSWSDTHDA